LVGGLMRGPVPVSVAAPRDAGVAPLVRGVARVPAVPEGAGVTGRARADSGGAGSGVAVASGSRAALSIGAPTGMLAVSASGCSDGAHATARAASRAAESGRIGASA
jgi:hypothetical protein